MKKVDIAYLSGIIDSDGCISISKYSNCNTYRVIITVVQRDMSLIEYLYSTFGGSVNLVSVKRTNKRQYYLRWVVTDSKAIKLLRLCIPYLKLKKQQGLLAKELIRIKSYHHRQGKRYSEKSINKQKELFLSMKSINSPAETERVSSFSKEMRQSELTEMINRQNVIRNDTSLINLN